MKKKITYFLKIYVTSLFTSLSNFQFFYRIVFRCKVLRLFAFYLFEAQSTVLVSSSWQEENVLIWSLFLTREGKKLLRYLYKIAKAVYHCFDHES